MNVTVPYTVDGSTPLKTKPWSSRRLNQVLRPDAQTTTTRGISRRTEHGPWESIWELRRVSCIKMRRGMATLTEVQDIQQEEPSKHPIENAFRSHLGGI